MELPFLQEIEEFERQDRDNRPPERAVLFLGSSTFKMWYSLAQDFPSIAVINRGFGGSQILDSFRYADRIAIPYKPRLIVFYAGDNDLASGRSPEQVLADYKRLAGKFHKQLPEAGLVFISIKPSPARAHLLTNIRRANALVRAWSQRDGRLAYADVFEAMLGENGTARGDLFVEDGLHMNPSGYAIWTRILAPFLEYGQRRTGDSTIAAHPFRMSRR
jgi:lysophospholipase L1-like esterase